MDRGIIFQQEARVLSKKSLNDGFVPYKLLLFISDKTLIDGLEWCGLLWCFISCLDSFFWRHPFTAEDPLVSKWCNATFLQICYDEKANFSSKLSFLGKLFLQWSVLKYGEAMFATWHNHLLTCLVNNVQRSGHSGVCSCLICWRNRCRAR